MTILITFDLHMGRQKLEAHRGPKMEAYSAPQL